MNASNNIHYSGKLSSESIDSMSISLQELLQSMGVSPKDTMRLRLCVEDVLTLWARELGENTPCHLVKLQRFGKTHLLLQAEGKSVDPTAYQDELMLSVSSNPNIASALGLLAEYRYYGGRNELKLRLPGKPLRSVTKVLIAIAAAIVFGIGIRQLAPALGAALCAKLITPLMDTITNSLRLISGPLVFLSIISGINGMGDASSLGKIGATLLKRFFIMVFAFASVAWLSVCWLFPISLSSGIAGDASFEKLFAMILDIVPGDMVSPFQTGNAIQIIFMAACVGVGLILLGDSVGETANMLNQVNAIVQVLMTGISKLMPAYIFLCISNLIIVSELSELIQVLAPLLTITIICFLLIFADCCRAALKSGLSPALLFKSQLPTMLICITTASSSAAFSSNVECCEKKLNIAEKLVHFGVPLGQVMFKPGTAMTFTMLALYMAKQNGVTITPAWIFTMLVVSTVLAMAAPPIPGGAMSCTMILFTQLGIPASCAALSAAVLSISDYPRTVCNVSCLQYELLICAKKLDMAKGQSNASGEKKK